MSTIVIAQQKTLKQPVFTAKNKVITVYTTTDNSDLKISKTDEVGFKELIQPLETQTCVFVNPNKKFQTFIGIGGAITDASAEVFLSFQAKNKMNFSKHIILNKMVLDIH